MCYRPLEMIKSAKYPKYLCTKTFSLFSETYKNGGYLLHVEDFGVYYLPQNIGLLKQY